MARLLVAFFLLIAMCFPSSVGAVGKSTVDPSAGLPKSSEAALSSTDVTHKVTYEAKHKTVVSILVDLSAMTGVTLKAGRNNDDWQVRDRRMNIFVKDVPLADLMSSVARVMKLKWSKTGSGSAVSYRLYIDEKSRLAAESKRLAEEERVKKRQSAKRKKLLSELEKASKMSEAELENLKTASPYVYSIAGKDRPERFLPKLFQQAPSAKSAFLSGDELTVDFDGLSDDVKKGLWSGFVPGESRGDITIRGVNNPGGCIARVTIAYSDDPEHKGVASRQQSILFGLSDPDSEGVIFCSKTTAAQLSDKATSDLLGTISDREMALETKDLGEPLVEHSEDPALLAKVKIKPDGDSFADALGALAKASGFSIVSDSFVRRMWGWTFASDETELRAVLSKLEFVRRYNWERHGSTLELHDRDWYKKLAVMIPEASIQRWRKTFVKNGMLDLGELSQIASLTNEQVSANLSEDDILSQAWLMGFGEGMANRDLLTAYAGMSKQQQALIFTKQGLALESLADSESPAAQALWRRCSSLQSASGAETRLTGRREVKDGRTYYFIDLIKPSGGFVGLEWIVRCPVYKPPIEKTPAATAAR